MNTAEKVALNSLQSGLAFDGSNLQFEIAKSEAGDFFVFGATVPDNRYWVVPWASLAIEDDGTPTTDNFDAQIEIHWPTFGSATSVGLALTPAREISWAQGSGYRQTGLDRTVLLPCGTRLAGIVTERGSVDWDTRIKLQYAYFEFIPGEYHRFTPA